MRTVATRLAKLEQLRPVVRDCPECGYPSKVAMRVVITDHHDPMPRCATCGQALDFDGVPLPRQYKRIVRGNRKLAAQ